MSKEKDTLIDINGLNMFKDGMEDLVDDKLTNYIKEKQSNTEPIQSKGDYWIQEY